MSCESVSVNNSAAGWLDGHSTLKLSCVFASVRFEISALLEYYSHLLDAYRTEKKKNK